MCYITIRKGKANEKADPFKSSTQDAKAGVKSHKTTAFKHVKIPIINVSKFADKIIAKEENVKIKGSKRKTVSSL